MRSYKSTAVCAKGGEFSSVLKPLPSSACLTDCVVVHFPGAELDSTRPPMRVQGRNREKKKNSVLKVSKSEFGLIKGLLYSSVLFCYKRGALGFEKEISIRMYRMSR